MSKIRGLQDVFAIASAQGTQPAQVAVEHGRDDFLINPQIWPEPKNEDLTDDTYPDVDLMSGRSDILSDYVISLAASIQFPANTAYLHALAVVSTAMNRSFKYEYYGNESPVNLYAVTSQPPSSGKSGVHKALTLPHRLAYSEINKANAKIRIEAEQKMEKMQQQLEKSTMEEERATLQDDISKLRVTIESAPHYRYAVDDATPEALESIAFAQGGLFNISSDEADAVNVLLGNVYSDKGSANHGMILKGWDGDWHSPARITRKTKEGIVYGSIAVIAQDEAINSILHAGMSGRGISERILILRERPVLGSRNHLEYKRVCTESRKQYDRAIYNLLTSDKITLSLTNDAMSYLSAYRHNIEPKLADGGEYGNTMLRGVVGKADKQIIKIACVLHGMDNWCEGGARSTKVTDDTVIRASHIFNELCKTYISAADSQGYMGNVAELTAIKESLERRLKSGSGKISVSQLRDNIKNLKAFKGASKLTNKLKDELLPKLVEDGYCVMHNNTIHISPKLK